MNPMVIKVVLWGMTLFGLTPALLLAALAWHARSIAPSWRYASRGAVHDLWVEVSLGSATVEIYPRLWALVAIGLGVVLVVVGLAAVLHAPFRFR